MPKGRLFRTLISSANRGSTISRRAKPQLCFSHWFFSQNLYKIQIQENIISNSRRVTGVLDFYFATALSGFYCVLFYLRHRAGAFQVSPVFRDSVLAISLIFVQISWNFPNKPDWKCFKFFLNISYLCSFPNKTAICVKKWRRIIGRR